MPVWFSIIKKKQLRNAHISLEKVFLKFFLLLKYSLAETWVDSCNKMWCYVVDCWHFSKKSEEKRFEIFLQNLQNSQAKIQQKWNNISYGFGDEII